MATKSKHTPGPWKDAGEFIIGADDTTVCQARDESAWDANARLIASAPDLLSAAQRVMAEAEQQRGFIPAGVCLALNKLRDAIEKATR